MILGKKIIAGAIALKDKIDSVGSVSAGLGAFVGHDQDIHINNVMDTAEKDSVMVALINMPSSSLMYPSLAVCLLKAKLNEAGLGCKVFNFNFLFADIIGHTQYISLVKQCGYLSEWLFAGMAWPDGLTLSPDEFLKALQKAFPISLARPGVLDALMDIRDNQVPKFLDAAMERLLEDQHDSVIGFSCNFFQTLSSLALIRRIKRIHPQKKIVCGGSSFHDVMGIELMAKFDHIDAVCLGEADGVVVPLFEALSNRQEPAGLAGVAYRDHRGRVCQGPDYRATPAKVLDDNPYPDFEEYFTDLESAGLDTRQTFPLVLETSRGCWKGEKQHCSFCGLQKRNISYRRMSTKRVMEHFAYLIEKYSSKRFMMVDRILPKEYIRDLSPLLKKAPFAAGMEVWAEFRSMISRSEIKLLADAHVSFLQVGIESLSTNILRCMRKSVTVIRNIYCLKLCRTYGVCPTWNMLVRVPGEQKDDYCRMADLIPRIVHFTPPLNGPAPVQMHRFSPYFNETGRWADHIRPWKFYQALYPQDRVDIARAVYYFEADWKEVLKTDLPYRKVSDRVDVWRAAWRNRSELPALEFEDMPDKSMRLRDSRKNGSVKIMDLDPRAANVFRAIDDPVTFEELMRAVGATVGGENEIKTLLESFIEANLTVRQDGRYLAIAVPKGAPEPVSPFRYVQDSELRTDR